jgi:ribosomal protein S18 acetylase RimI-like enzyme
METVTSPPPPPAPKIAVERLTAFDGSDINDICDAAEAAIVDGGGFGWLKAPPRHVFEAYWRGVLLVPERQLFVGRLDGVIAGAAQLVRPPRNNEAQGHAATLTGSFVAPWARGHGLARGLTAAVEDAARAAGYRVLNLDVRETQTAAIAMYEARGYARWGTHPRYAMVDGGYVAGHFYTREL